MFPVRTVGRAYQSLRTGTPEGAGARCWSPALTSPGLVHSRRPVLSCVVTCGGAGCVGSSHAEIGTYCTLRSGHSAHPDRDIVHVGCGAGWWVRGFPVSSGLPGEFGAYGLELTGKPRPVAQPPELNAPNRPDEDQAQDRPGGHGRSVRPWRVRSPPNR